MECPADSPGRWTTDKVAWAASATNLAVWATLLVTSTRSIILIPTVLVVLSVGVLRRAVGCTAGAALVAGFQTFGFAAVWLFSSGWLFPVAVFTSLAIALLFGWTFVRLDVGAGNPARDDVA